MALSYNKHDGPMATRVLKKGKAKALTSLQEPGRCDTLDVRSTSHLASAMSPAKARQMWSSTATILCTVRVSASLAAAFRSAPTGGATHCQFDTASAFHP